MNWTNWQLWNNWWWSIHEGYPGACQERKQWKMTFLLITCTINMHTFGIQWTIWILNRILDNYSCPIWKWPGGPFSTYRRLMCTVCLQRAISRWRTAEKKNSMHYWILVNELVSINLRQWKCSSYIYASAIWLHHYWMIT